MLENLNHSNTALIIVDKQKGYTTNNQFLLGTDPSSTTFSSLILRIDTFIKFCRSNDLPIVWTQMVEDPQASPSNIASKMVATKTPSIAKPGSKSFEFNGLQPIEGEKIIVKKYYDAFSNPEMHNYLQKNRTKNIIIVGGYTSRCILGTAYGANSHGYNLVVAEELVGNPDRFANEVPVALAIIDSILGYVIPQNRIIICSNLFVP